jgi:hypothetical protein
LDSVDPDPYWECGSGCDGKVGPGSGSRSAFGSLEVDSGKKLDPDPHYYLNLYLYYSVITKSKSPIIKMISDQALLSLTSLLEDTCHSPAPA